jgi:hypothetical protein
MPRMSEMLAVIRNFKKYIDETLDDPINKFSDVQILHDFITDQFEDLFNESKSEECAISKANIGFLNARTSFETENFVKYITTPRII